MRKTLRESLNGPLHFANAAFLDGYLWTSALEWNGYYKIDLQQGTAECLGLFEHMEINVHLSFSQVLPYGQFVFFIPWFSNYLVRLDTRTLETKYWKLPNEIIVKEAKFRAANIFGDKIFMFPMYGDIICIFNIKEEIYQCDARWKDEKGTKNQNGDFLPGIQIGTKIYLPSCLANRVFEYDLNKGRYETVLSLENEKGILDIEKSSDNELLILSWRGNVWRYNFADGKKEQVYKYKGKTDMPYIHVINYNGRLYLIPAQERNIKRLEGNHVTDIPYPLGWNVQNVNSIVDSLFYGYYKINDCILLYPIVGNMILQLDTNINIIKGIELCEDKMAYKREMDNFIRYSYPISGILDEYKMGIKMFGNMLGDKKRMERQLLRRKGAQIWNKISR